MKSITQALSELTERDSIPDGLTMLLGTSGSGKTIFAEQLTYETLLDSGRVLWITTEELPSTLRSSMLRFGWKVEKYESGGKFQIVDAVSPARLGLSANMGRGELGLDPTGMLILVTEQLKRAESEADSKFLIVIDSISRLLLACETKSVIDFVSCLSSRLENYRTKGIVTVAEGAHDEKTLSALIFSCNGTIRFKLTEEGENRYRQLRLETLRGRKYDDRWKNYMITNTGFDMEI